jgi:nucleotidyltransferase/DNA polymerase involved in DNA repair
VQASLEKASIDEVFLDVTSLVEKELLVRPDSNMAPWIRMISRL